MAFVQDGVTPSQIQAVGTNKAARVELFDAAGNSLGAIFTDGTQKSKITDTLGNSINSAATGFIKVSDEPRQLFYDSFDAALDTTNMWTSTQGSSGVAATVALGMMSMGTGVLPNGYSKLTSIPTFKPTIPGWVVYSDAIQIPDAAAPTAPPSALFAFIFAYLKFKFTDK